MSSHLVATPKYSPILSTKAKLVSSDYVSSLCSFVNIFGSSNIILPFRQNKKKESSDYVNFFSSLFIILVDYAYSRQLRFVLWVSHVKITHARKNVQSPVLHYKVCIDEFITNYWRSCNLPCHITLFLRQIFCQVCLLQIF